MGYRLGLEAVSDDDGYDDGVAGRGVLEAGVWRCCLRAPRRAPVGARE